MLEEKVRGLLDGAVQERKDLFLVDLQVSSDQSIKVTIDGDKGVDVEDCMFVSRAIEHQLDREEFDFSLEVTSAGAASPITNNRQFNKNLGREMEVKTIGGEKFEGKLKEIQESGIVLEWKTREPKEVGKGKITVKKQAELAFDDIESAKVILKF
ncbi:ribosome assembly cofactor RimP [Aegicerativicinus sediminis]|uniref:ribosome assembly cofactor RimP n=1 Tax=Aegicerativicinus sediminis TaxID=2893202 RepID=UPI001E55C788|nr:ribosome assembly cofactor RimP [Aegicerativicinus sediminis]